MMIKILNLVDYQGGHKPGSPQDDDAPAWDLTRIYPEDIYSDKAARYYGDGGHRSALDWQVIAIMQSLRNKPNATVKIYRAVPDKLVKIKAIEKVKNYIHKHGKIPKSESTALSPVDYYDKLAAEQQLLLSDPKLN